MAQSDFWDNQEKAQEVVGQLKSLKSIVGPMDDMIASHEDLAVLMEMAAEDPAAEEEVQSEIEQLERALEQNPETLGDY